MLYGSSSQGEGSMCEDSPSTVRLQAAECPPTTNLPASPILSQAPPTFHLPRFRGASKRGELNQTSCTGRSACFTDRRTCFLSFSPRTSLAAHSIQNSSLNGVKVTRNGVALVTTATTATQLLPGQRAGNDKKKERERLKEGEEKKKKVFVCK
ncbi:unnamed protein product [Pleuronectes platessa]|uniref:Uncharacterized protein n=1 Tax=Pleuronectes platessa TaxID=8262 RepID=A0A9N7YH96_PLEPL|nr:unnamed protein product [Pleuronectes platessa]